MNDIKRISEVISTHTTEYTIPLKTVEKIATEIVTGLCIETLRDKFAGKAMTALIRNLKGSDIPNYRQIPEVAELAYRVADGMLEQRIKE